MALFSNLINRIFGRGTPKPAVAPAPPTPAFSPEQQALAAQLGTLDVNRELAQKVAEEKFVTWQYVNSSWIKALRYDPRTKGADMMVKSGKVYLFGGMSFRVFEEWMNAPSKGKYFIDNLKGRFTILTRTPQYGPGILSSKLRGAGFRDMDRPTSIAASVIAANKHKWKAIQAKKYRIKK